MISPILILSKGFFINMKYTPDYKVWLYVLIYSVTLHTIWSTLTKDQRPVQNLKQPPIILNHGLYIEQLENRLDGIALH